jgi:hypothetical protein
VFANSYAVGHLVNHPPADRRPNVVSLPFDFLAADLDAHDHLRRHIPNVYFLPRRHEGDAGADGVVMSGMVIVAADDLGTQIPARHDTTRHDTTRHDTTHSE